MTDAPQTAGGYGDFSSIWGFRPRLSKPVFVVLGITSFFAFWNSYVWPIMTITEFGSWLTQIQQYLGTFRSEWSIEYGMLLAGSTRAALPVIVLFLVFQRHIISGIRTSGIK